MSGRREPPTPTAERLEAAALGYLARFSSSAENLRRVLARRVRRWAQATGGDAQPHLATIETLVERFVRSGLLDDRAYARAKAASLHRRGVPSRGIAARLAMKGIDRPTVGEMLLERPGGDLAAAVALVRRRRFGPCRASGAEPNRDKEMAAMARAGFPREIAVRVLGCSDPEALAALLEEEG